ncbi:MAG: hypothetical protein AAB358_00455 [Patescibacteria group bacterium]
MLYGLEEKGKKKKLIDFKPKKIKFFDLYKHATKNDFSPTAREEIQKTLTQAGYTSRQISNVLFDNEPTEVKEIKKITQHLVDSKAMGFDEKNPRSLVDSYVKKEMIRQRNLSRVMHDRMMESFQEELMPKTGGSNTPSAPKGPKLSF